MWAVHSLAQLRQRYGDNLRQAILSATSAKLTFGGLTKRHALQEISGRAGTERSNSSSPLLPVKAIQEPPPFNAWPVYRGESPRRIAAQPAFSIPVFAGAASGG